METENIVKLVSIINRSIFLVEDQILRKKNKRLILILLGLVYYILFNPYEFPLHNIVSVYTSLKQFKWYDEAFWLAILILLIIIVVQTYVAQKHKIIIRQPDEIIVGPIKGLLSYKFEDAEHYSNLQRGQDLIECLQAITHEQWRFGVLSGDSGVGKTSFLLAGLMPSLVKQDIKCIYVKFSKRDPLDSIRQACNKDLPNVEKYNEDYLEILKEASRQTPKPIVMIFDQFEQFFLHQKKRNDRERFYNSLKLWYQTMESVPIKLLISIRSDNMSRLFELQKVLNYTLSPTQIFELNKFEPIQAANILRYIADREQIKYDFKFLQDLSMLYLAYEEDGLVSPVDIQVIARIVQREISEKNRAFDNSTFEKCGGYNGLLVDYLDGILDVYDKQGGSKSVAIKVLHSLMDVDNNISIGAHSIEQIQQKIGADVKASDINKVVLWLEQDDVRLIVRSVENNTNLYELIHDRIIPAFKIINNDDVDLSKKANKILRIRANEWKNSKVNNRKASNQYLLSFSEIFSIYKFGDLLPRGKQQSLNEEFLAASIRRLKYKIIVLFSVLLLIFVINSAWQSNKWQLHLTKRHVLAGIEDEWLKDERYNQSLYYRSNMYHNLNFFKDPSNEDAWADILSSLSYIGEDTLALQHYNKLNDSRKEVFLYQYTQSIFNDCSKLGTTYDSYIRSVDKIANNEVKDYLYIRIARVQGACAIKAKDINKLRNALSILDKVSRSNATKYTTLYEFAILFSLLNDRDGFRKVLDQANEGLQILEYNDNLKAYILYARTIAEPLGDLIIIVNNNNQLSDEISEFIINEKDVPKIELSTFLCITAEIVAKLGNTDIQNMLLQKAIYILLSGKMDDYMDQVGRNRLYGNDKQAGVSFLLQLARTFSKLQDKEPAKYILASIEKNVEKNANYDDNYLLLEIYAGLDDKDKAISLITSDLFIEQLLDRLTFMSFPESQSLLSLICKVVNRQDELYDRIVSSIILYFNNKYVAGINPLSDSNLDSKLIDRINIDINKPLKQRVEVLMYSFIAELYATMNSSDKASNYINKVHEVMKDILLSNSDNSTDINYYRLGESIANVADMLNDTSILDKGINIFNSEARSTVNSRLLAFRNNNVHYDLLDGLLSSPITCSNVSKLRKLVNRTYTPNNIQSLKLHSSILKYCSQPKPKFKKNTLFNAEIIDINIPITFSILFDR